MRKSSRCYRPGIAWPPPWAELASPSPAYSCSTLRRRTVGRASWSLSQRTRFEGTRPLEAARTAWTKPCRSSESLPPLYESVQGGGWAQLPGAPDRKDPHAGYDLGWQFLFPAGRWSRDPATSRKVGTTSTRLSFRGARRVRGRPNFLRSTPEPGRFESCRSAISWEKGSEHDGRYLARRRGTAR